MKFNMINVSLPALLTLLALGQGTAFAAKPPAGCTQLTLSVLPKGSLGAKDGLRYFSCPLGTKLPLAGCSGPLQKADPVAKAKAGILPKTALYQYSESRKNSAFVCYTGVSTQTPFILFCNPGSQTKGSWQSNLCLKGQKVLPSIPH